MDPKIAEAKKVAEDLGLLFKAEYRFDKTRVVVEYASAEPPEEVDWVWADPPHGLGGARVTDLLESAGFRQEDAWMSKASVRTYGGGYVTRYYDGVLYTRDDLIYAKELAGELGLRIDVEYDDDETRVVVEYVDSDPPGDADWVWARPPHGLGGVRVTDFLKRVGFRQKDAWAGMITTRTDGGGLVTRYRDGVLYSRLNGPADEQHDT